MSSALPWTSRTPTTSASPLGPAAQGLECPDDGREGLFPGASWIDQLPVREDRPREVVAEEEPEEGEVHLSHCLEGPDGMAEGDRPAEAPDGGGTLRRGLLRA